MERKLDVLFVHPGDAHLLYQGLSDKFSSIETPTWCLLLAQSCRSKGFGVAILDCDAERLSHEDAVKRIKEANPRLVCFVVYGQNPNAGTTKMTGAIGVASLLKKNYPEYPVCFVGSHVSALPGEVLGFPVVDFVLLNEGVYALRNLLATDLKTDLQNVKGIGWKDRNATKSFKNLDGTWRDSKDALYVLNEPERVVPNDRMDIDLPGSAWDLLPYKNKPFDLYRSCNWHADFNEKRRSPYAAIYTSLGCPFSCAFCMINILNRTNNAEGTTAADSNTMRFWSSEFIAKEIDKLVEMGVSTIRISDEMYTLNRKYYVPLSQLLSEKDYANQLQMWAYARVDTVNSSYLDLMRSSGVKWLALGVESIDQKVRQEIYKGSYKEVKIRDVVKSIGDHGISTIANYIFGLPDDDYDSMNRTLDAALDLNTEMVNMYCAAALPGSPLFYQARQKGWALPQSFEAWSFHSYDSLPLPTKHLSAGEVLRFRDRAWDMYFKRPEYHKMVEDKFGRTAVDHIKEMASIKLKRKLLGD